MKSICVTLALLISGLYFTSCNSCGDIACTSPAPSFFMAILDADTKQNIFVDHPELSNAISIKNVDTGKNIDFRFDAEGAEIPKLLEIRSIGWDTEVVDLSISIGGGPSFIFHVDVDRVTKDCCTFTTVNEATISNIQWEKDSVSNVFSVFYKF